MKTFLRVYTGPMFSGKSTALISDIKKYNIAGKKVKLFKPSIDNRNGDTIHTHVGVELEAISINRLFDIFGYVSSTTDIVAIDEFQFFEDDTDKIVYTLNRLLSNGITVIISSLDMDRNGNPFGQIGIALAMADEIHKLKAVCRKCSEPAGYEFLNVTEDEKQSTVLIGGDDKYIPLCRKCFYESK